jgi:5-formyltetrahydrofolate cyclo-ligase
MDKASLRRHMHARLHALSDRDVREANEMITSAVINLVDWGSLQRVSCYQSRPELREVNTAPIIDYIRESEPHITLDLVEPHVGAPLPSARYDLVIVPVLAYDDEFNRLGRGAGWYDRFLATQPDTQTIGLAFSCQRVESIPIEEFDVPMDEVITE